MANTKQAKKRARQNPKRALNNMSKRSAIRTSIKKASKAIESKNKDNAQVAYKDAAVLADRMARKGIIHPNKAARLKSRLNKRLKALA